MTLRQQCEDEGSGVHDQVDAILDSEDSMIILIDARRAINYVRGFALSPCQLELLANDIERLVRTVTRAPASEEERERHDHQSGMDRREPGRPIGSRARDRRGPRGVVSSKRPAVLDARRGSSGSSQPPAVHPLWATRR